MKTRYTASADQECYFVRDALSNAEPYGPYANYKAAQHAARTMNAEWLQEVVEAKDTLFKAGLLSATENKSLNSKLDKETKQPWVCKSSWGSGRNKKARGE